MKAIWVGHTVSPYFWDRYRFDPLYFEITHSRLTPIRRKRGQTPICKTCNSIALLRDEWCPHRQLRSRLVAVTSKDTASIERGIIYEPLVEMLSRPSCRKKQQARIVWPRSGCGDLEHMLCTTWVQLDFEGHGGSTRLFHQDHVHLRIKCYLFICRQRIESEYEPSLASITSDCAVYRPFESRVFVSRWHLVRKESDNVMATIEIPNLAELVRFQHHSHHALSFIYQTSTWKILQVAHTQDTSHSKRVWVRDSGTRLIAARHGHNGNAMGKERKNPRDSRKRNHALNTRTLIHTSTLEEASWWWEETIRTTLLYIAV